MALPRFFDRVHAAVGRHVEVEQDSLASALENTVVAVACGSECGAGGNGRWIAELLVNLLARLYPRLWIDSESDELRNFLMAVARAINPSVEFVDPGAGDKVQVVAVGAVESPPDGAINVRSDGWVASISDRPMEPGSGLSNPYSAAAAAALAASEVFRRAFGLANPQLTHGRVSLLDYSGGGADLPLPNVDVGEAALVGLGAVGNAAVWMLSRHHGLQGVLHLVDDQSIELSNLQRYVLATDTDVGAVKVELAARQLLERTQLGVRLSPSTLEEFADTLGDFAMPTVLVCTDDEHSRRSAQALLPRLVVNGWTGDDGLGASWHEFDDDGPCLACMYHPTGPRLSQTELVAGALGLEHDRARVLWTRRDLLLTPEDVAKVATAVGRDVAELGTWVGQRLPDLYSNMVCGAAAVNIATRSRLEIVPLAHQSVLAGVLMAAEFVKRVTPKLAALAQVEHAVQWDGVTRPPPKRWACPRGRVTGCICGDPLYQARYRQKWRGAESANPEQLPDQGPVEAKPATASEAVDRPGA